MRYAHDLIIPAGTLAAEPFTETIRLNTGTIQSGYIRFRSGCHNQVFVAVFVSMFQIVPVLPSTGFYGDDFIFEIPMNFELFEQPFELTLKGWSPGTEFDHTITFWFDLMPQTGVEELSIYRALAHLGEII